MHSVFIEEEKMTGSECLRIDLEENEEGRRVLELRDFLYNSLTDEQKELMDSYEDAILEYSNTYDLRLYDILTDRAKDMHREMRTERARKRFEEIMEKLKKDGE